MSFLIESETYSVEGREHSCFNMAFHSCGILQKDWLKYCRKLLLMLYFCAKNWESQQSVTFVVKKAGEFFNADLIAAREKKNDLFTRKKIDSSILSDLTHLFLFSGYR